MTGRPMKLAIVTASTDLTRAAPRLRSWLETATTDPELFVVLNGRAVLSDDVAPPGTYLPFTEYLGTVPAFLEGTKLALSGEAPIIACLHDDLIITDAGWDDKVLEHFRRHTHCGLLGFGGAIGLGDEDLYRTPYAPVQLARKGFRSNLRNAEAHGLRSTLAEKVACLDGFSQIGRREFWQGLAAPGHGDASPAVPIWEQIAAKGLMHHMYDGVLGALAIRDGWDVWYLPVACDHLGGQTAVGDAGYQAWAQTQDPRGDAGFWEASHKIAYDWLKQILPIRV
jgi:hypothetical protein